VRSLSSLGLCRIVRYGSARSVGGASPIAINLTRAGDTISITIFAGKSPEIRALFNQVVAAVRKIGPARVLPEKTRIAFQVRMSFAQVTPKSRWLDGHVVLARRFEHPRFRQIQTISPRNHVHAFRLTSSRDIDADFRSWLAEAYCVGEQRHLDRRPGHAPRRPAHRSDA
jgi:hypothetical protein